MEITLKNKIYEVLIPENSKKSISRYFNIGMLLLITLNILAVIIETEEDIYLLYKNYFDLFETFSVVVFTIEYLLRLWVCTKNKKYASSITGRIRFALQPSQIIDLLAILPFYIPFLGLDFRFLRAVRLFRLFRIFKMGKYSRSLTTLINVIRSKKEELIITLFAGFVLLIIASSLMFLAEHDAQPEVFASILDSIWWGAVTLTTVGYGDIYPITFLGKLLGSFIALLGIGLFALPAGIVASGFASEIHKEEELRVCPHCGKSIDDTKNE